MTVVILYASNGDWNYGKQNAESKSGLCDSFDDALIIWAISWSGIFHIVGLSFIYSFSIHLFSTPNG